MGLECVLVTVGYLAGAAECHSQKKLGWSWRSRQQYVSPQRSSISLTPSVHLRNTRFNIMQPAVKIVPPMSHMVVTVHNFTYSKPQWFFARIMCKAFSESDTRTNVLHGNDKNPFSVKPNIWKACKAYKKHTQYTCSAKIQTYNLFTTALTPLREIVKWLKSSLIIYITVASFKGGWTQTSRS